MAEEEDDLFAAEEPVHLQQLKAIAAALQAAKKQSDSVTWVPETIPSFTHDAVKKGLEASRGTNDDQLAITTSQDAAGAAGFFSDPNHNSAAPLSSHKVADAEAPAPTASASLWSTHPHELQAAPQQLLPSTPIQQHAAGTAASAAGPAIVLGSQHWRSGGSSKRVDWVVTTCLVPDGMPTAAAAEEGGGLAALEVVCRVLVLQDCQPAAATTGLSQALKRVRWQEFGLLYKDFCTSSAADDLTGILTLGVLPDAIVMPLAMIVCSCVSILPSSMAGLTADCTKASACSQPDAAAVVSSQPSQHIVSTAADASDNNPRKRKRGSGPPDPTGLRGYKRRKGGSRDEANMQMPKLSTKREKEMYVAAFEAALTALKQQLPEGYLHGKLENLLTTCLPRVSNPSVREVACQKLNCQPLQLQQQLLTRLQTAAADAIAAKSQLAASRQQQQQPGGRKIGTSAAAAPAVAACAGDSMQYGGAECKSQEQQQLCLQDGPEIQDSHEDSLQQQPQHEWQQLPEYAQQQGAASWQQNWPVHDQQLLAEGRSGTGMPAAVPWADIEGMHKQQLGPQQPEQQHEEDPWQQQQQQQGPWQQQQDPWLQQQQEVEEEDAWQQQQDPLRQQQLMLADQQQFGLAVWQQQELTGPAAAQAALQPEHLSSQWDKPVACRVPTNDSILDVTSPQVAHEAGSAFGVKQTVPSYRTSGCIAADQACGGITAGGLVARTRKRFSGSAAADLF